MKNSKMLTGTVKLINIDTNIAAILVDDGEYAIAEMFDEIGLAIGDRVSGTFDDLGDGFIKNITTGMSGTVWIDDILLDRETAVQALRRS